MRGLLLLFRDSRGPIVTAAALSVVAGLATSAVIVSLHGLLANPDQSNIVLRVGLALVLMLVASFAARVMLVRLSFQAVQQLSMRVSKRVLAAPLKRLEDLGPARVMALFTEDVDGVAGGVMQLPTLLSSLSILLVCFAYLGFRSPALLAVLFAVLFCAAFSVNQLVRAAHRRDAAARQLADATLEHVRHVAHGNKELKLSRARLTRFLEHDYLGALQGLERAKAASANRNAFAQSLGSTQTFVAIVAIAFAGKLLDVDFPTVATFGFVVLYISAPLGMAMSAIPPLSRSNVSMRNLRDLGMALEEEPHAPSAEPLAPNLRTLSLAGVSHVYDREDGTKFTLGPLSLDINAGECTFIVGGNGSGKSTLVKLLVGLYAPETGQVQVDGVPITPGNQDAYRELFAVVFADYFLPRKLPAPAGIDRHLAELQLTGKVTIVNGLIDTTNLSSGQRKRLALLAAICDERPVYVFDEWASDQDPQFKEIYYRKLLPELRARGKAVVVVTHDDRYFELADRIVQLEDGQIRAEPPPSSLPKLGFARSVITS